MVQCWCHAAMAGWLGAFAAEMQVSSHARMRRWQYECERAGGDCAARVEAIALRLPCARAARFGASLRIYARRGTVEFHDGPGDRPELFRYLGFLEPLRRHLVWRRGEDGVRFITVGQEDGLQSIFESLGQMLPAQHAHGAGAITA